RIEALPSFKKAIPDPDLLSTVTEALSVWSESKNLFVVLAILEKMHVEHQSTAEGDAEGSDDAEGEAGPEEEDEEEEEEEEGVNKALASIGRYRDLVAVYAGAAEFKKRLRSHRFLAPWFDGWEVIGSRVRYGLFAVRRRVALVKRTTDDLAYSIMQHLLAKPADTPFKVTVALFVWMVLVVVSALLSIAIYVLRPGKLLEFIGWDDEVLPVTE
ncbi:MAG: hypothetical protein ACRED5_10850, partial [Propylenella sp.]